MYPVGMRAAGAVSEHKFYKTVCTLPIHSNIIGGCNVHAIFALRLSDVIGSVLGHVVRQTLFPRTTHHLQVSRLKVTQLWNRTQIMLVQSIEAIFLLVLKYFLCGLLFYENCGD